MVTTSRPVAPPFGVPAAHHQAAGSFPARDDIGADFTTPPPALLREALAVTMSDSDLELGQLPPGPALEALFEHISLAEAAEPEDPVPAAGPLRRRLEGLAGDFVANEKQADIDGASALAFVQLQIAQHALPEEQQDRDAVTASYEAMLNHDDESRKEIVGGRFSGGWLGAGSFYAMSGHLMSFVSALPSLYTLTRSKDALAARPEHYADLNLALQLSIAVATPVINSGLQIVMVALQELVRKGYSNRSVEMKAPVYGVTDKAMRVLNEAMDETSGKLERHEAQLRRLAEEKRPVPEALQAQILADQETAERQIDGYGALLRDYQVRKDVTDLNYIGQSHQSLTRSLRVLGNLASAIVSTSTKDAHAAAGVQIGVTVATMLLQQFWAAPADEVAKQQATLAATAWSTNLVLPAWRHLPVADLRAEHLNLAIVAEQWKGPIGVAVDQTGEYLALQIAQIEQELAGLAGLTPHEWRTLNALQSSAVPLALDSDDARSLSTLLAKRRTVPFDSDAGRRHTALHAMLEQWSGDRAKLKSERWGEMSEENQLVLLDALNPDKKAMPAVRTAIRTAWARMCLSSEFIPQVAQRFGSSYQMFFAGTNMALVVTAIIRIFKARAAEAHQHAPLPDWAQYLVSITEGDFGILGAYASGALINEKISRRNVMRADAQQGRNDHVGIFQPKLTGKAIEAIARAMVALPVSVSDRIRVDMSVSRGGAMRADLMSQLASLRDAAAPPPSGHTNLA